MSFFKTQNALAKAEFRGFGGIDTKDVTGRGGKAADIVNFRVLPDGTLKKRCGYRRVASMPGKIRAMLTGYFDGEFLGYVLADGQVFKLDFATGERTLIGSIGSISGDASIFYYLGNIFVIDGEEIYQLKDDEIISAEGYVPLFGKNWGSTYPGEINEPINLLNPRARISYIVSDPPTIFLATLYDVVSVEAVYGAEWYNNLPILTNRAACHNATIPFTRNVIGPMDYTPCTFSDSQHPHITTHAHELALTVLYESTLQHLADKPESYLAQPQEVQNFLSNLPTVWDETRFMSGYPGESAVLARRSGDTWFIAGINGKDEPQTLTVDYSKIIGSGCKATAIFQDSGNADEPWDIQKYDNVCSLSESQMFYCQPRGGFVMVIR